MQDGLRRPKPATVAEMRSRVAKLSAAQDGPDPSSRIPDAERLVRFLPEAVMVHCNGRLVFANNAAAKLLRAATADELLGREILSFVPPDQRTLVREETRHWRDERLGAAPLRHKSLGLDGSIVDVETTALAIDWNGQDAVLLVSRDLSERIAAEERYRGLVELMPDAVYIHDGEKILFINPSGIRMFGAERAEDIVGRSPLDFSHPTDRGAMTSRARDVLGRNAPAEFLRRRRLRTDGSEYLADVAAVHLHWQGKPTVLVVVRDVTDQVRAADELRRSNADLEQFAYVASHDLQEPLRTIGSYCQLLQRRYKDRIDKDASEYIDFAVAGAKRMQLLINDLLQYSRVGTRGKPLRRTECNEVFADAVANLHRAIAEAGAEVASDPLPAVEGDRVQLGQLFQNLIGNAIKFRGDAPPKVHVSARKIEDEIVFCVRDNGIGIEPQHRERIFQIFQRLHERDRYPGTGIGLAVCKKIVERHGGRIWIESAADEGSSFQFTLPGVA